MAFFAKWLVSTPRPHRESFDLAGIAAQPCPIPFVRTRGFGTLFFFFSIRTHGVDPGERKRRQRVRAQVRFASSKQHGVAGCDKYKPGELLEYDGHIPVLVCPRSPYIAHQV